MFVVRRQIFIMVVFWVDFPALQIIGLVLTNEFWLIYIVYARPFTIKEYNRSSIINEISVML